MSHLEDDRMCGGCGHHVLDCECFGSRKVTQEEWAEGEILRLCRNTPTGGWVMRNGVRDQQPCNVFNLSPGMVRPYGKALVADGATWVDVLLKIEAQP